VEAAADARLTVLAPAAHLSNVEQAGAFLDAMLSFLI
jgi:pimeloyl-ACP methyl ester carboxylesterase